MENNRSERQLYLDRNFVSYGKDETGEELMVYKHPKGKDDPDEYAYVFLDWEERATTSRAQRINKKVVDMIARHKYEKKENI